MRNKIINKIIIKTFTDKVIEIQDKVYGKDKFLSKSIRMEKINGRFLIVEKNSRGEIEEMSVLEPPSSYPIPFSVDFLFGLMDPRGCRGVWRRGDYPISPKEFYKKCLRER